MSSEKPRGPLTTGLETSRCPVRRKMALATALGLICFSLHGRCETPVEADSVADSIGVNIHLHYNNTVYGNFPLIEGLLKNLGIRHTRDGLINTTWKPYYERHTALGKDGIHCIFMANPAESDSVLVSWPDRVPGEFEGYEAPNEWDNGGGPQWAETLTTFLPRLYRAVKSNPATSRYPVIGPSLIRPQDFAPLVGLADSFDFANMHNYFAGHNPGTAGWGANGYGSIEYNLNLVTRAWPGKPVISTETGYYTEGGRESIPESIEGEYAPRLVLEQMLHGIRRTYFYELIDENPTAKGGQGYFGLAHADGSPKPAYTALKNMIALFSDPGPQFTPKDLPFSLTGATSNVHHLVAARRDGTYDLAVWVEAPNYDFNSHQPAPSEPVRITFTSNRKFQTAAIHQFTADGTVKTIKVPTTAAIPFTASETVLVLSLK
jgi:hypothetical protein